MPDRKTEFVDGYREYKGRRLQPIDVPFMINGIEDVMTCIHAAATTGLIGNVFPDGRFRAIQAMRVNDQLTGIYQAFTAEECRTLADVLTRMADDVDKENAKL
jgi:hypothetical protein